MKKDIKRRRHGGNAAYIVSNCTKYVSREGLKRGWQCHLAGIYIASVW